MLGEIVNSVFSELTPEDRMTMTSGGSVHMGINIGLPELRDSTCNKMYLPLLFMIDLRILGLFARVDRRAVPSH